MAKGSSISGNGSEDGSGNDSYTITGRGTVSREQMIQEIKDGRHPDTHVVQRDGEEYARNNPNSSTQDNIND